MPPFREGGAVLKDWKIAIESTISSKLKISKISNSVRRISYCCLSSHSIAKIDDSRGLDSSKINTNENLISAVETSVDDDE